MAKQYRKASAVEREAVRNVRGTVRHSPLNALLDGTELSRTGRKALASQLTPAQRREYSEALALRSRTKAKFSRQARQAELQTIAEFQAVNSARAAQTRQKGRTKMFAQNIMASLRGDNKPAEYSGYNVSKRFVLIAQGQRTTLSLLRHPAIVNVTHDNKGNVVTRDVIQPVKYAVMAEASDGSVEVLDVDNSRAFSETLATEALDSDAVQSALAEYIALQTEAEANVSDMTITSEHLRFVMDVISFGKAEALQRVRLRKLRNDTREIVSRGELLDHQIAHAARLALRSEAEAKAIAERRALVDKQAAEAEAKAKAEAEAKAKAEAEAKAARAEAAKAAKAAKAEAAKAEAEAKAK